MMIEPIAPKDLTPAEITATMNAYRLLAEALDNNTE